MLKKILLLCIESVFFIALSIPNATAKAHYNVGIANGFPPFQFKNINKEVTGFDAAVINLLFQKIDEKFIFQQMKWQDVIGSLMFTDKLDCVTGMEITNSRKKYFDFTSAYSFRRNVLFVSAENNNIKQLKDLLGKTIGGDKGSNLETQLEKMHIKNKIRIKQTKSKEESMQLLKAGKLSAIIAPQEVGLYLAKKMQFSVKIIAQAEQQNPVAIAVKKGHSQLLNLLEKNLQILIKNGDIARLQQTWKQ